MNALILNLSPTIELTDEQFFQVCQNNRDLSLERTAQGELIIMPPTPIEKWKLKQQSDTAFRKLDRR